MLSGGIDSPVAAYLTMKRGVAIECIHYASPPYTSDAAQDKVLDLARAIAPYQDIFVCISFHLRIYSLPFINIVMKVMQLRLCVA